MAREIVAHNKPVFDELHPNIYGAAVGFVAWFAVAAWVLFDRQGDIGLPLAMVSVLLLIAVLLPWALSLVWKRHVMPYQRYPTKISFRDWRASDFAVWGSKLHSTRAAVDMLLPLAAVAFGLTAIGIVFVICANGPPQDAIGRSDTALLLPVEAPLQSLAELLRALSHRIANLTRVHRLGARGAR